MLGRAGFVISFSFLPLSWNLKVSFALADVFNLSQLCPLSREIVSFQPIFWLHFQTYPLIEQAIQDIKSGLDFEVQDATFQS